MDVRHIKATAERAREFDLQVQGVTLHLRLPLLHEFKRLHPEVQPSDEQAFALVRHCVIGWSGIPASALAKGEAGALVFDAELIDLVLDRYPDAWLQAYLQIVQRVGERQRQFRAEEKNSQSASPGS